MSVIPSKSRAELPIRLRKSSEVVFLICGKTTILLAAIQCQKPMSIRMSPLKIAFLIVFAFWALPANAGWLDYLGCKAKRKAMSDNGLETISRDAFESKIANLLSWKKDEITRRAKFEGCVLVLKLDYSEAEQAWRQYKYIERRANIEFLKTDFCFVDMKNQNKEKYTKAGRTTIFYETKDDIYVRLRALENTASIIVNEEMERYPFDVKTRLKVIAQREKVELDDKIYLDAGEGYLRLDYTWNFSPRTSFLFDTPTENSERFMELVSAYGERFCGGKQSG